MSNGNIDYKLGQFDQAINDIQLRLKSIERKIDELNIWRVKVIAAISIVTLILNFTGNQFFKIFFK